MIADIFACWICLAKLRLDLWLQMAADVHTAQSTPNSITTCDCLKAH